VLNYFIFSSLFPLISLIVIAISVQTTIKKEREEKQRTRKRRTWDGCVLYSLGSLAISHVESLKEIHGFAICGAARLALLRKKYGGGMGANI
jgi:hypothetical protein